MSAQSRPHDAPTVAESALSAGLVIAGIMVLCYGLVKLADWIVARFSL